MYFCTYLYVNCIIAFSLILLIRRDLLTPIFLYIPIAFLGLSESIVSLLQYAHIISSQSSNFEVTGTLDNPNITAMVLCLSIPALIEIIRMTKKMYGYLCGFILVITGVSLLILQCRTAIVGVAVVVILYVFNSSKTIKLQQLKYIKTISFCFLIFLSNAFFFIQHQKQASSDGRLTIWKISAEMISKKPISGYGYGLFQREYNLQQADYFNRELRPEQERMNAGFTGMAYNEYIEQTVMGGLLGGLLFTAMILSLLVAGWKNRNTTLAPFIGVAAFAAMSLFNFTINSPMLLFTFMIYASVLLVQTSADSMTKTYIIPKKVTLLCTSIGIVFIVLSIQKYNAQQELKVAKQMLQNGEINAAGVILDEIEPDISTSEAYYRTRTSYYLCHNDYDKALASTVQALSYASYPFLVMNAAELSVKLGKLDDVERYCKVASGIEPHVFRPRVMQMEMYVQTGQQLKANLIANDILTMKPKFMTEKVKIYKQLALRVLNENQRKITLKKL